jgi:hypothetical protein
VGIVPVGSGEAAWVRTPSGRFLLIGGGPPEMGGRVVRSLKAAGARTIALVVQPYPYAEAIGGCPRCLKRFRTRAGHGTRATRRRAAKTGTAFGNSCLLTRSMRGRKS